jgi:hypothetical protein
MPARNLTVSNSFVHYDSRLPQSRLTSLLCHSRTALSCHSKTAPTLHRRTAPSSQYCLSYLSLASPPTCTISFMIFVSWSNLHGLPSKLPKLNDFSALIKTGLLRFCGQFSLPQNYRKYFCMRYRGCFIETTFFKKSFLRPCFSIATFAHPDNCYVL